MTKIGIVQATPDGRKVVKCYMATWKKAIPAFLLFVACCEPPTSDTTIIPAKGLVYECYATKGTEITTPNIQCEGTLFFCNVHTNASLYRYIDHTIVAKCNNGDYYFNVTDVKFASKKDR